MEFYHAGQILENSTYDALGIGYKMVDGVRVQDNSLYHERAVLSYEGIFDSFKIVSGLKNFTIMEARAAVSSPVSATPEPSSYALLLIGFCGLAAFGERKKTTCAS